MTPRPRNPSTGPALTSLLTRLAASRKLQRAKMRADRQAEADKQWRRRLRANLARLKIGPL